MIQQALRRILPWERGLPVRSFKEEVNPRARKYRAGSLFSARVRSRRPGRAYDLAGRPRTVNDTTGQGLSYSLDSAKRVTSVAQTAPNISGTRTVIKNNLESSTRVRTQLSHQATVAASVMADMKMSARLS